MKYLLLSFLCLIFTSGTSFADQSLSCDVHAKLAPAPQGGNVYEITIVDSRKIVDGKYNGEPCFMHFITKQLGAVEGEDIPTDKDVLLHYEYDLKTDENGQSTTTKLWRYDAEYKGLEDDSASE